MNKETDSQAIVALRSMLINSIDSSGNFSNYWMLLETDVDTMKKPIQFHFKNSIEGKRTFVAFTPAQIFAINEGIDSSFTRSSEQHAPAMGIDTYALQPDSIIQLHAQSDPNRLKIASLTNDELVVEMPGINYPMKYKKVLFTKLKR